MKKCYVKNQKEIPGKLYLLGSENGSVKDQCVMKAAWFNLDFILRTENDSEYWSSSQIIANFNAFKLAGETDLTLVCIVEVCLKENCPSDKPNCS